MESSPELPDESQAVRDLEWVLKSPSLLTPCPTLPESLASQYLVEAQNELQTFLTEGSGKNEYRVGRYFEKLVLFYLKHIRKVEIVANGLQLQEDDGRTVGELDFVFRDEAGQLQHWETAVKFYLHFSGSSKCGSHFIGPDSRDNFEKKRQRLFEHQLPLSARQFPDVVERHAFVKGRIFYHPEHLPPQTLPDQLSPGHLRGVWIYRRELAWLSRLAERANGKTVVAKVLPKPFWLAQEEVEFSSGESDLLPVDELQEKLQQHFRDSATPRLVSLLAKETEAWCEFERVFVVPESWPHWR